MHNRTSARPKRVLDIPEAWEPPAGIVLDPVDPNDPIQAAAIIITEMVDETGVDYPFPGTVYDGVSQPEFKLMNHADMPYLFGTRWNKQNVLADETKETVFGQGAVAAESTRIADAVTAGANLADATAEFELTPNDAFMNLAQTRERTNILHNWDFRNPVNQRGLTEYAGSGIYTIDRWRFGGVANTISTMDSFVRHNGADDGAVLFQIVEFPMLYSGKTLTLSVKYRTSSNNAGLAHWYRVDGTLHVVRPALPASNEWTIHSFTFEQPPNSDVLQVGVHADFIDVQAVKLELGPVSTLANDPPMDFGRELAVCQRYQVPLHSTSSAFMSIRVSEVRPDVIRFMIPLPTTLRAAPTIVTQPNGEFTVRNFSNHQIQSGFTFSTVALNNVLRIDANRPAHGLVEAYLLSNLTMFDANL